MAYLPDSLPVLDPGCDDAPWWEALRRHELLVQRCAVCDRWRHPPSPLCPACQSTAHRWQQVIGRGRLFSYTVVHHAVHPALTPHLPYNVALVELPDAGNVRIISNVVDASPDVLAVGLEVEVVFEDQGGVVLPRFRPASERPGER
jgi:hypothetical protein